MVRILIAFVALALVAADASAGPLQRARERRAATTVTVKVVPPKAAPVAKPVVVQVAPAASGCANGKCGVSVGRRFGR